MATPFPDTIGYQIEKPNASFAADFHWVTIDYPNMVGY